jgi:hypothetical protein
VTAQSLVAGAELHPGLIVLPSLTREATWRLLRLGLEHLAALGEASDVMVNHVPEVDGEWRRALHALAAAGG